MAQQPLASQQQTPEWGAHAYLCQHILLITRKTTKYTALIAKEQQKVFRLFEEGFFTDSLNFIQKSQVGGKSFPDITIQSHNVCSLVVHEGVCLTLKTHVGNHVSHSLFVGQMPKLVISLTDKNKTARNSSLGTETSL